MGMAGNATRLKVSTLTNHLPRPLKNYMARLYIEWLMWGFVEMYTAEEWSLMYKAYLKAGGSEARWNKLFEERTFDMPTD